jgi:dihydrofolate reductase
MITGHVFIATSLDGFIARPDGDIDWLLKRDDPTDDHGYPTFIADKGAIVMGRGCYEKRSSRWANGLTTSPFWCCPGNWPASQCRRGCRER